MPGRGEARALDREGDAGAAPVELLGGDHAELPVGVAAHALHVIEAVEAPPARLLDHLPRSALVPVVLGRRRTNHLAGELAAAVLELTLLISQSEIHASTYLRGPTD